MIDFYVEADSYGDYGSNFRRTKNGTYVSKVYHIDGSARNLFLLYDPFKNEFEWIGIDKVKLADASRAGEMFPAEKLPNDTFDDDFEKRFGLGK